MIHTHARKGQGAVEFALISTAMMLIFATFFIVAQQNFKEIEEQRFETQIYTLLTNIETEVQLANEGGEGYSRQFSIPQTIVGRPYTIRLNENMTAVGRDEISLVLEGEEYFLFLAIDVQGNLSQGNILIQGGSPINISTI